VGLGWLRLLLTSFQLDAYAPTLPGRRQCLRSTSNSLSYYTAFLIIQPYLCRLWYVAYGVTEWTTGHACLLVWTVWFMLNGLGRAGL
jgi:hypothetical protein